MSKQTLVEQASTGKLQELLDNLEPVGYEGARQVIREELESRKAQEKAQEKARANNVWRARLAARLAKVTIVSEMHFYSNGGMIAKAGGLEL